MFNYISFNYADLSETIDPAEGGPIEGVEKANPVALSLDSKPEIRLTPNPVSDVLNVEVAQTENCRVIGLRVMDLSGKIRLTQEIEPSAENYFKSEVDVSAYVPGIYVMQVQTTSGMIAEKISVIK